MWSNAGYYCLRYRDVWEVLPVDCRKPILITEAGVDGQLVGRHADEAGWMAFGYSEEEYLAQIDWYMCEIAADRAKGIPVEDVSLFHGGSADSTWDSFSVLGCDDIAAYMAERNQAERNKEEPMSLASQFPNEYRAWLEAGGIENNFRAHLLGTGVIKPTADDLKILAAQALASAKQLQNALNDYPF